MIYINLNKYTVKNILFLLLTNDADYGAISAQYVYN